LRVRHSALFLAATLAAAAVPARAEYFVLRSGQRLHVTGYQLLGEKYRLQMDGGFVELPADNVAAIEPEDVFTSAPPVDAAKAPFRELIEAAAARYVVDADLITSVIAAESNFDPKAISRRNARGLMQLLPETAARLGVQNIFDPRENIDAGTRYLHDLLLLYKNDLALALAAYNA
jgi:soluble lytic murein transglycosylase-like protein